MNDKYELNIEQQEVIVKFIEQYKDNVKKYIAEKIVILLGTYVNSNENNEFLLSLGNVESQLLVSVINHKCTMACIGLLNHDELEKNNVLIKIDETVNKLLIEIVSDIKNFYDENVKSLVRKE